MYSWRFRFFLKVHLGYLRIISITNLREDDKACNVRLALLGEAEELLPPRPAHCTIIHGPLRNCVNSVESVYQFWNKNNKWYMTWYMTYDTWYMTWYMITDIWYLIIWHMNQNETIWDEMRRENELHTSVITTARDSRDMKAHLACLKSGPSEPHVPSVEGKQLTTSAFQVAQFQTSNYPTFCNVFQTSQLLECSPAEKPFGGKAWLLKVVSLDKLDMGLTCSTQKGAWGVQFRFKVSLMALLIFQWFQHVPTCSNMFQQASCYSLLHWATCHWSKPSTTICKICKTLSFGHWDHCWA